ncbi:hypothetical protein AURDEDRAFT_165676 [Auricularia subglabra TFB-10046 SS5]|nr:hypothetical protein AURDEDRAFT_165676 [Auricularia subglabra TFB-10046 SS5]
MLDAAVPLARRSRSLDFCPPRGPLAEPVPGVAIPRTLLAEDERRDECARSGDRDRDGHGLGSRPGSPMNKTPTDDDEPMLDAAIPHEVATIVRLRHVPLAAAVRGVAVPRALLVEAATSAPMAATATATATATVAVALCWRPDALDIARHRFLQSGRTSPQIVFMMRIALVAPVGHGTADVQPSTRTRHRRTSAEAILLILILLPLLPVKSFRSFVVFRETEVVSSCNLRCSEPLSVCPNWHAPGNVSPASGDVASRGAVRRLEDTVPILVLNRAKLRPESGSLPSSRMPLAHARHAGGCVLPARGTEASPSLALSVDPECALPSTMASRGASVIDADDGRLRRGIPLFHPPSSSISVSYIY